MNTEGPMEKSQRVLLTGGRAPATLDLARQLSANNHHVFMAESCPNHLCIRSKSIQKNYLVPMPNEDIDGYILALQNIIKQEQIDWLIPTCEEIFHISENLHALAKHCHVFVESFSVLRNLHNKWEFISTVKKIGLPTPQTYLLHNQQDVKQVLSLPGKWVFKRVYSRFSSNVIIVDNEKTPISRKDMREKEKLYSLIEESEAGEHSSWIAQEFIAGTAYCSYSIAVKGKLKAHATYPVEFTAGQGACISFSAVEHEKILNWVTQFVKASNFTGQIAFDFFEADGGIVYPIECNPRTTSGVHLFLEEDRLDRAFFQLDENLNDPLKPEAQSNAMISLAMLSYGLLSIRSWRQLKRWLQLFVNARDCVFLVRDPQPFFQQFSLLWWNLKLSKRKKISIMEATTYDIEWNGERKV